MAFLVICLLITIFEESLAISIANVYTQYWNSEVIDQADTFGWHVPKPLGHKGGEPIWSRNYDHSGEMFFDENGVAFPVRPRNKLKNLIHPLQQGNHRYDNEDESDENKYDEKKTLHEIYKKFKTRMRAT